MLGKLTHLSLGETIELYKKLIKDLEQLNFVVTDRNFDAGTFKIGTKEYKLEPNISQMGLGSPGARIKYSQREFKTSAEGDDIAPCLALQILAYELNDKPGVYYEDGKHYHATINDGRYHLDVIKNTPEVIVSMFHGEDEQRTTLIKHVSFKQILTSGFQAAIEVVAEESIEKLNTLNRLELYLQANEIETLRQNNVVVAKEFSLAFTYKDGEFIGDGLETVAWDVKNSKLKFPLKTFHAAKTIKFYNLIEELTPEKVAKWLHTVKPLTVPVTASPIETEIELN